MPPHSRRRWLSVVWVVAGGLSGATLGATSGWLVNRNNNFDGGFYAAIIFGGVGLIVGIVVGALVVITGLGR